MADLLREFTTETGSIVRLYMDGTVSEETPDTPVHPKDVDAFHAHIVAGNLTGIEPEAADDALRQMYEAAVQAIPYYQGMLTNWGNLSDAQKDRLLYNLTRAMLQSIRYLTGKLT